MRNAEEAFPKVVDSVGIAGVPTFQLMQLAGLYATSTQANAAFPASRPVRTVIAWALLRSAANDTGSMAPKDRKENTEGVSE